MHGLRTDLERGRGSLDLRQTSLTRLWCDSHSPARRRVTIHKILRAVPFPGTTAEESSCHRSRRRAIKGSWIFFRRGGSFLCYPVAPVSFPLTKKIKHLPLGIYTVIVQRVYFWITRDLGINWSSFGEKISRIVGSLKLSRARETVSVATRQVTMSDLWTPSDFKCTTI